VAKDTYIKLKTIVLLLTLCANISSHVTAQNRCADDVLRIAKKDVGIFEGKSNTGAVQKYTVFWNSQNPKNKLVLTSPYCGLAIYYWYAKAGFETNIAFTPRAINWHLNCKTSRAVWKLTKDELEEIPKGSVIVYQNSWGGNHVGLIEKYNDFHFYTIEGNTSTGRSINKYDRKGEGVFYLKTHINNKSLKSLYVCDVLQQSTEFKGK
jgi:hypothetical protein